MRRFYLSLILLILAVSLLAQPLPRSTPEAEGVSSSGILNFVDAISSSKHEPHSFMILRHGKVIAEGWWNPYRADLVHTMYSVSKSFTATAIGFAVAENKLSVNDKVISFFPNDLPDTISTYLSELKIKDLLTMSVGHATDPTGRVNSQDNWVRAFLRTPIVNQPGTKFVYNSAATYMLSAIMQKVTGQKIIDYLQPRLFGPLGISGIDWEIDSRDINVGGWGLRLKTEDMAKFGQLFLQQGKWKGKPVLPAAWVTEASTKWIDQAPDATQARRDTNDWVQGYGYQMWRSRYDSYRGDGAFGQYILILPEQDAVIIITSETTNMQGELNLVWQHLLPSFTNKKLPADAIALRKLKARTASLSLPLPKSVSNATETAISGKIFGIISSDRSLQDVQFDFNSGMCTVTLSTDSATHALKFGAANRVAGTTTKKGPYLVAGAKANRVGLSPYKLMGNYYWKDANTLELALRYMESPHTEYITCVFDGDYVNIQSRNSFNPAGRPISHKGVAAKKLSTPPRLIIRGDDMGFSHSANEALIKSYKEGIETSIEVIVPSPWFPEAVKLLKENPGVDVGLHFAITSEWDNIKWRPLTQVPSLQNEDGYFYPMLYANKNYPNQAVMNHAWKLEEIEKELRAQIVMIKKYIPRVSHISGHMNSTGFHPEVKAMAKRVAKEYNLVMVDVDPQQELNINYIGFDARNKTTEQRIDAFIEMLDRLEPGKTYVFVEHPGINNDELKAIYHIGYEDVATGRQDVTNIFTSEKVKEAIVRKGVKLVSYAGLN